MILVFVISALIGASMFLWPDSRPIGVALFAAAALLTVIRTHRTPRCRPSSAEPTAAAPRRGLRPPALGHLDLSDETPTSRSYVEVIPAGTFTLTPQSGPRRDRVRARRAIFVVSANALIYALAALHREAVPWAMAIPLTTLAGMAVVVIPGRTAHPTRKPAPGREWKEMKRHTNPFSQLGIEQNARLASHAIHGRSE